jgi:hypothetical protein
MLKVPSMGPIVASNSVTLLLPEFATQMLPPSKATPCGVGAGCKDVATIPVEGFYFAGAKK